MNKRSLPTFEFVTLMAMLFAMIAFSIDAMLPALPEIGAELYPDNLNNAQLIITSFILGMGIGTLFTGPLSDSFGRKPILFVGVALYIAASLLAWAAKTLELMLIARILQGLGVAGPRVVGMAIIRDLYHGRRMAKLMSFTMLVFSLVPAIAPTIGAMIMYYFDWRMIFVSFVVFACVTTLWLMMRQHETLPINSRIPFRLSYMQVTFIFAIRNEMFLSCTLVITLVFGMLMALLSSTQQIYDIVFEQRETFHLWFGLTAVIAASSSLINAALVERLGMRVLVSIALGGQLVLSTVMAISITWNLIPDGWHFCTYFIWSTSVFFMIGLTIGNLNALAMEPMGHIAGMAASIIGGVSNVLSVAIAIPIGLAFNGSPLPLTIGIAICCGAGCLLVYRIRHLERRAIEHEEF
jgi:DHA1 family bicyclomycin/chloramphenicol resistance-like MFS transporter